MQIVGVMWGGNGQPNVITAAYIPIKIFVSVTEQIVSERRTF